MPIWPGSPLSWTSILVTVSNLNTEIRDRWSWVKTSLDDEGHLSYATIQSKSGAYTVAATDDVILCTGASSFTITLLPAVSNKHPVSVVNNSTGTITIGRTGADTVGLATSQILNPASAGRQGDSMTFIPDNVSNWAIV